MPHSLDALHKYLNDCPYMIGRVCMKILNCENNNNKKMHWWDSNLHLVENEWTFC